jgi:hypothetical protein
MNRIIPSFIIAATTVFATAAFADDITPTPPFASTRDRAEVQAELLQFRGQANPWSIAYNPLARFQSSLTRDEVRAQFLASRDDVAAMTGEDSGSFALAGERTDGANVTASNGRPQAQQ